MRGFGDDPDFFAGLNGEAVFIFSNVAGSFSTIPPFLSPMRAMKRPIPILMEVLRDLGIPFMTFSLTSKMEKRRSLVGALVRRLRLEFLIN